MSGLTGIELKKRLDSLGSRVPAIIITAQADPSLPARARESGAFCLLKKPFDAKSLIKCLNRALAV